jgi:succinate dehydrogenase / fumarate reductase cytochrome b subunit
MPARARPLSPHLQVYRWQMGSTLSMLHRLTGVVLALGLLPLTFWLVALAGGDRTYGVAADLFASVPGEAGLIAWSFAFFYHLLNGVRHLVWDAGYGFERTQRHLSGWLAVGGAAVLTLCVWAMIWHGARA